MIAKANTAPAAVPLCVDLDHTLLKTDLLFETLVLLAKRSPLALLALPYWLLRGRAFLKHQVARRIKPQITQLPFREELVAFLRSRKEQGQRLVLVSAADQSLADAVQKHLGLFCEVIASKGNMNVRGGNKAKVLEDRFGKAAFDYIGDSQSDFAVWRSARRAFVVTDRASFANAVRAIIPVEQVFSRSKGRFGALIRAIRVHQWSKNLLIFVPVVTSHRILESTVLLAGFVALLSFNFFCSGVYLINDLIDLEVDRASPSKRARPLASGELSILSGIVWASALLSSGVLIGFFAGLPFLLCLVLYGIANVAYSLWLKRVVMLDVVVLACLYSLRLLAGGAATGIYCSEWLLAFSVFFFFCLATIKRYSELRIRSSEDVSVTAGRGYFRSDLEIISTVGSASGLISVLILILYVMSPEVRLLYRHPTILLLLCPLLLYWIARIWFKAHRGEIPQDPVVFALTDKTSYISGVLAALVIYTAS